jgi:hypothetical protein
MQCDAKWAEDEHASSEYKGILPKVTRYDRANDRSEERPDKTLGGNREGRPQSDDWVIIRVVIGAQYASGSRSDRAAISEAIATTAVRAECTKTGHLILSTRLFKVSLAPVSSFIFLTIKPCELLLPELEWQTCHCQVRHTLLKLHGSDISVYPDQSFAIHPPLV